MNTAQFSNQAAAAAQLFRILDNLTPTEGTAKQRRPALGLIATARKRAERLAAAAYFYPEALAAALAAHGVDNARQLGAALTAYTAQAYELHRAGSRPPKAAPAAYSPPTREQLYAAAAKQAAQPKKGRPAAENEASARGYAFFVAAGVYPAD